MLAKRVIPCMDVKDGRVVKGVNFVNLRDAGDPIELAQRYDEQRADEVIFLDITATSDKRETTVDLASRASAQLHLPYCVGGGFRSVADIRRMIAAGADKVSVNSAAVANPQLITDAAAAFGGQAILCAIDAKRRADNPNKWEVYVHGGRTATGIDAVEWAAEAARRGAGEILLTSMDRDGSKDGFDCALTRAVARAVDIPVIASGGVGKLEHFAEGIIDGEADAVLAAETVQLTDNIGNLHLLAVQSGRNTLLKGNRKLYILIRCLLRCNAKNKHMIIVWCLSRILKFKSLMADMPDISVTAVRLICSERKINAVCLTILNLCLTGIHTPSVITPWSDYLDIRSECLDTKLETNLIVTLTGCTVADCNSIFLAGDLYQLCSDRRSCHSSSHEIFMFVNSTSLYTRHDVVLAKIINNIFNIKLGCSGKLCTLL